jgi:hypothetical protein
MRKLLFALTTSTALLSGAMITGLSAIAAPGSIQGIATAAEDLGMIQNAAFIHEGRKHCWYGRGWHAAGWYWCGYAKRKGLGWGGEEGWNGWRH